jgi:hypothetical protein
MLLRLFHNDATAFASYLFGCTTHDTLARAHDTMLGHAGPDAFAAALVADTPPRPAQQEGIVDANRRGDALAST